MGEAKPGGRPRFMPGASRCVGCGVMTDNDKMVRFVMKGKRKVKRCPICYTAWARLRPPRPLT
jgi:NAD-dependent SIR2 family protein deacetylase